MLITTKFTQAASEKMGIPYDLDLKININYI